MNDLWLKTAIAGVFFGAWPLIMNKSKLPANFSTIVFCGAGLMVATIPLFLKQTGGSLTGASWTIAIISGLVGGIGLLSFSGMLAKATPETVSTFFLVNLLIQISVPALYQVAITRNLSASRGLGFLAAGLAAYLLAH